jgi:hypothetical protein
MEMVGVKGKGRKGVKYVKKAVMKLIQEVKLYL